ncbi:MAG: hypothetical protein WA751_06465 [Candidatus Dormiibacterota bacterium]
MVATAPRSSRRFAPCQVNVAVTEFVSTAPVAPVPTVAPKARLVAPGHATAGRVVKYQVVLADPGSAPVNLDSLCPAFDESLVGDGFTSGGEYSLNCTAAGSITSGQQLSFAMELHIPRGSPRGQAHLDWFPYPGPVPLKVETPASRLVHIS